LRPKSQIGHKNGPNQTNINLKCDDCAREAQTSGSVKSKPTVNGGAQLSLISGALRLSHVDFA
jgi:hypothetical protein